MAPLPSSCDHVHERRRPIAVLAASGVPAGVLRRSIAVEIGVPLFAAILQAAGTAIAAGALFASIIEEPVTMPLGWLAAVSGVTVAAVTLVTGFTWPALARAARPEALQMG